MQPHYTLTIGFIPLCLIFTSILLLTADEGDLPEAEPETVLRKVERGETFLLPSTFGKEVPVLPEPCASYERYVNWDRHKPGKRSV